MPFDAATKTPVEVLVIDKALEVLGPKGEYWIQGKSSDRRGGRCLMGAIGYAKRMLGVKGDRTVSLVFTALHSIPTHRNRIEYIENYNDKPERTFDEIAGVLVHARNIAASQC
jgi:hypothetical protein